MNHTRGPFLPRGFKPPKPLARVRSYDHFHAVKLTLSNQLFLSLFFDFHSSFNVAKKRALEGHFHRLRLRESVAGTPGDLRPVAWFTFPPNGSI